MTRGKHSFASCLMIIPSIVLWQEARWRMIGLMVQRRNPTFPFRGKKTDFRSGGHAYGGRFQANIRESNVAKTEGGGLLFQRPNRQTQKKPLLMVTIFLGSGEIQSMKIANQTVRHGLFSQTGCQAARQGMVFTVEVPGFSRNTGKSVVTLVAAMCSILTTNEGLKNRKETFK